MENVSILVLDVCISTILKQSPNHIISLVSMLCNGQHHRSSPLILPLLFPNHCLELIIVYHLLGQIVHRKFVIAQNQRNQLQRILIGGSSQDILHDEPLLHVEPNESNLINLNTFFILDHIEYFLVPCHGSLDDIRSLAVISLNIWIIRHRPLLDFLKLERRVQ